MDSLDPKKDESMHKHLEVLISELKKDLDGECLRILEGWEEKKNAMQQMNISIWCAAGK